LAPNLLVEVLLDLDFKTEEGWEREREEKDTNLEKKEHSTKNPFIDLFTAHSAAQ
jgi:hypothetical protein